MRPTSAKSYSAGLKAPRPTFLFVLYLRTGSAIRGILAGLGDEEGKVVLISGI